MKKIITLFIFMLSLQSIFSQTNISLNKTSTASGGNDSSGAFDGDLDTAWNAVGYAPAWVSVDLGSISNVNHIVFNVSQSPDGDTAHYVYSSIDGINWQQVDNFNFYTSNHQEFTRNYTNLNGIRYLKVLTSSSPSWVSWYEISVFGTQEPIVPTIGQIAFYPFNNNADDESGNNNNGTINGATITTDRFGDCSKAYSFNGTNNQIVVGNNPIFDLTNTITLSAWVLPNTLSGDIKVLSKFQSGSNSYQLSLYNGTASFQIIRGGSLIWDKCESDILQVNQWQHIVCTYDNTEMKVYVNGILKNTLAITGAIHISTAPVIIGNYNGGNSWFNGKIDNVRIYSTALSNQEVTDLYNAEKPSNVGTTNQAGITVLVHGFQFGSGTVDNNFDFAKMGHDILQRAGGGVMYKNNKETGQLEILEGTFDSNKEIVLVYDWWDLSSTGVYSNNFGGNGYLESAGDNLFATILKLANPTNAPMSFSLQQFLNKPKHLIGHSRGTILLLQTLHRFANYFPNTNFEQVTFLDPHPATVFGDLVGAFNTVVSPPNLPGVLGSASDCGITGCLQTTADLHYPSNVLKADNYYRKDGEYEGSGNIGQFDGLPIIGIGSFNRELNNSVLAEGSPTFLNVTFGVPNSHSGVHKWYKGTINTIDDVAIVTVLNSANQNNINWYSSLISTGSSLTNNFMLNECRSSTGFAYSRIGGRYNDLPLINPNYKLTLTQLNQALAEREGVSAIFPNGIAPHNVFNGDFHYNNSAGWIKNGGTTEDYVAITSEKAIINQSISNGKSYLKHSLMYFGGINENYKYLKLDVKKHNADTNGKGIIKFHDENNYDLESFTFDINILSDTWKTLYIPIPNELKPNTSSDGKIGSFSVYGFDNNSSVFEVDNFELINCTPISNNLYVAMPDPSTLNFADIDSDHWAKEGIYKSRNYGLFRGTSPTTFTPNTSLTKAEAITVLVRAGIKLGIILTYNTTGLPYADVDNCNQFFPYIQTAKNLGHLEYTNNFSPNDPITVAQLCVYMDKILQINLHDWNATTPNTPWVLAPTSQYIQSQLSQIVINQPEPSQNAAMRRILHCIDVIKNDNIIDSYRTQNVWTLKDVENINISNGQPVEVDGTATVTRARMAVASANLYRFVYKKLNNGNAPAGRLANQTNTTTSDPSIDDFIGIGNTFDNKDVPATDTPEAPTQITFNINSGETLNLQYQSDTDTAGNPQFFYWSMNKNVDSNLANLVSVPINSIQNHRKVSFVAPVVTAPKTWYLYSYLANNKGKIKETVITINVSSTLSTNNVNGILDNVKIYPNPTDNILFIDTLDKQIQKIELFDLQGRLLKTINENKEKYQIDISNFSSATYLIKLSTEKGSQTVKVVKK